MAFDALLGKLVTATVVQCKGRDDGESIVLCVSPLMVNQKWSFLTHGISAEFVGEALLLYYNLFYSML